MEIETENDLSCTAPEVRSREGSRFDSDKKVLEKWLSAPLGDDVAGVQRRLDVPASMGEAETPEAHSFSVYGHCSPLAVQAAVFAAPTNTFCSVGSSRETSGDIQGENPANDPNRLLRLMEAQQAWYDFRELEAAQAAQLLILVEHHQSQWIR